MPEANSAPIPSTPVSRYPRTAPEATPKPKLPDRLREALRSRHNSRRTEFTHSWMKTQPGNANYLGKSIRNPRPFISITAGITQFERARGFLEAATLSEAWMREMARRALILEAHHTTHIEGTRLTFEQAERLPEGKRVPEADSGEAREILN